MRKNLNSERLYRELEELAGRLFPEIRREDGWFRTGFCTLNGKRILFLNNRQTIDEKITALAKAIGKCEIEEVYLKPAIRAEVERHVPAEDF